MRQDLLHLPSTLESSCNRQNPPYAILKWYLSVTSLHSLTWTITWISSVFQSDSFSAGSTCLQSLRGTIFKLQQNSNILSLQSHSRRNWFSPKFWIEQTTIYHGYCKYWSSSSTLITDLYRTFHYLYYSVTSFWSDPRILLTITKMDHFRKSLLIHLWTPGSVASIIYPCCWDPLNLTWKLHSHTRSKLFYCSHHIEICIHY